MFAHYCECKSNTISLEISMQKHVLQHKVFLSHFSKEKQQWKWRTFVTPFVFCVSKCPIHLLILFLDSSLSCVSLNKYMN